MEDNANKIVYQSTSDFLKYVKDRQKIKTKEQNTRTEFKKKPFSSRDSDYRYS
ncbi:MAG: hypothetical protein AABZ74_04370 [Cyanobacteriota bacterium]